MLQFLACYSGALDQRVKVTAVSGFRQVVALQEQPIYRNVWAINREFGGPAIVGLLAPREFIYETGQFPETQYPPPGQGSDGAAPGKLARPDPAEVEAELPLAKEWLEGVPGVDGWKFIQGKPDEIGTDETLSAFLDGLGLAYTGSDSPVKASAPAADNQKKLLRQYSQILEDTQSLMRESEFTRRDFWNKAVRTNAGAFVESAKWYRDYFLNEIVGPISPASLPPNPRSRQISETDKFTGYEVVLDVHPNVFAYGILLIPKGIKPGEKRPVVVCQHGLEGYAREVAGPKIDSAYYHRFAVRLAEEGFVTFAPQNPYIGENRFRLIQRQAHPLKLSLFSFILGQHQRLLEWLGGLAFVDRERIGFYGLSYGGKTAMRVPPLLDGYALSICSADFNEWIWKTTRPDSRYCYMLTREYDMLEFNLANVANYSDLANLMAPRPFMVERGHDDPVAPDEWVAYEYAKVRRFYSRLGIPDRTEIEFFNGPHTIHGVGTFAFLRRHLQRAR